MSLLVWRATSDANTSQSSWMGASQQSICCVSLSEQSEKHVGRANLQDCSQPLSLPTRPSLTWAPSDVSAHRRIITCVSWSHRCITNTQMHHHHAGGITATQVHHCTGASFHRCNTAQVHYRTGASSPRCITHCPGASPWRCTT